MKTNRHIPTGWASVFDAAGLTEGGDEDPLLWVAETFGNWADGRAHLLGVFLASKPAAVAGVPIVYVVHGDDLLGRNGAPAAMVATGILSAARSLALETRKAGAPVNVIARGPETTVETVAAWCRTLLESGADGPTGELIQLGGIQIGKALA